MADTVASGGDHMFLECPPTPEHVAQCPTTPPPQAADRAPNPSARIRDFLKSQLNESSEDAATDGDDNQQRETTGAGSPPPNCAICLGKINSKCFTDSCMHQFCFSCLLEWSKIKAECPLCKQTFKSIIHNVTSMDKYEEYKVEHNRMNWSSFVNPFEQVLYPPTQPMYRNHPFRNLFGEEPQRDFSIESGAVTSANYRQRVYQLFLNDSPLIERFVREFPYDVIPSRASGAVWRAYIYQRGLYALPLLDVTGRSRDISAEFYRDNPAQIHRLMAWLNREVMWIMNTYANVTLILEMLEELITTYHMTSRMFRTRIQIYFNRFTSHFIHELTNFARSHYDMIGYDRHVQYQPYYEDDVESIDSEESTPAYRSDDTSSDELLPIGVMLLSDRRLPARFSAEGRISDNGVIVWNRYLNGGHNLEVTQRRRPYATTQRNETTTGTSAATRTTTTTTRSRPDRSRSPSLGSVRTVSSVASTLSMGSSFMAESSRPATPAAGSTTVPASLPNSCVTVNLDDSDNDSDACVFVGAQKPPHLRTPEMVELNSESDSDVQFVQEIHPVKLDGDPGCSHPTTQNFNISSSDDELTELLTNQKAGLTTTVNRRVRKKQQKCSHSANDSDSEEENKPLIFLASASRSSLPTPALAVTSTIPSTTSVIQTAVSTASTSSAPIPSNSTVITKNYARPVRRLSQRSKHTIYEASSSSSSSTSSPSTTTSSSSESNNSDLDSDYSFRLKSYTSADGAKKHKITRRKLKATTAPSPVKRKRLKVGKPNTKKRRSNQNSPRLVKRIKMESIKTENKANHSDSCDYCDSGSDSCN